MQLSFTLRNIMPSHVKLALVPTLIFALCQCAQKELIGFDDPCSGVDLYELGRQDGSLGKPSPDTAAVNELGQCVPKSASKDMKVYMAGRNAGLVEYCTKENGYSVGRSEQSYFYVCPEFMETDFLTGYHRGVKVRRLQEETQRLKADIAELSDLIANEPRNSKIKSLSEAKIKSLREQQAKLDKQLSQDKDSL